MSRIVDGIFPNAPNISGSNMNISSPLDSLSSKSAALKSAFKSSTNISTSSSNCQSPNILNHPNLTNLIPGIGGYQYEVRLQTFGHSITRAIIYYYLNTSKYTVSYHRRSITKNGPDQISPTKQLKPNGNSSSIMKVANGKMLEHLQQILKEHLVP